MGQALFVDGFQKAGPSMTMHFTGRFDHLGCEFVQIHGAFCAIGCGAKRGFCGAAASQSRAARVLALKLERMNPLRSLCLCGEITPSTSARPLRAWSDKGCASWTRFLPPGCPADRHC